MSTYSIKIGNVIAIGLDIGQAVQYLIDHYGLPDNSETFSSLFEKLQNHEKLVNRDLALTINRRK